MRTTRRSLVITGGSGFIGSAVVRAAIARGDEVVNIDSMTYAATSASTAVVAHADGYRHVVADINDGETVRDVLDEVRPDVVMHLAAETHVDRSIDGPLEFVRTNVAGTVALLRTCTDYYDSGIRGSSGRFVFHHISTDEVFGALGPEGRFDRTSPYDPRSPYSASKAAADHFVRAWGHTYGLPYVVSNTCNNYGPFQYPEKLIPLIITRGLAGDRLPVYGRGDNVREWLHVEDHARALLAVADRGEIGETYLIGSGEDRSNLDVVRTICASLDALAPRTNGSHEDLIEFVADRPGHDFRYAIDSDASSAALDWRSAITFEQGIDDTVKWYVDHEDWWRPLLAEGSGIRRGVAKEPQ